MIIGQIIGNYKIEAKLGEGGMGAVYKGVDTMLDREVAIKALKPELASQTAIVERFRSEAVTLAKLQHPNIATLYSLFRQGDELYMVLEYVRGETLDTILQRRGALSAAEAIPVFSQVLDGIDHAHEYGIIHRDIKPANLMLTERGTLKVLDFGIARLLGSARMTRAGSIIGTLEYMAPEQVKGQETDARSDIYALGMMLYEVLTGKTPFDTENEFELMKLQTESMPILPRQINPNIPEAVEAAIMRSIAKNPDERFQTAGEFRETLLDAGFASSGAMRGITGSHQSRINTRPSQPSISQPDVEQPAIPEDAAQDARLGESVFVPTPNDEIKETRLGANTTPDFATVEAMRETRLGVSNFSNAEADLITDEPSKSFLDNLTWIHYAGAGFAVIMLLGLLAIVPLFILGGNNREIKAEEFKSADKPAIEKKEEKKEEKPAIILTPESPQTVTQQPVLTDANPPLRTEPPIDSVPPISPEITVKQPVKPDPKPDKSAPKQDTPPKRETVTKKSPPKSDAPAKPNKSEAGREERLRRLLTDN
ncbi:MAG: protein kinase [Acidobacteria bacterium]|nr:protein kinase [Acidobacteriota bacterium]